MKVWRKKEKKDKRKIPRWLRILLENSHRWAGVVAGPPGSGKTTFLKALAKSLQYNLIIVSVKEKQSEYIYIPEEVVVKKQSEYIYIPEEVVVKKISAVLHFTATDIRPAFDAISSAGYSNLAEIENVLGRFRSDVVEWIQVRLKVLKRFLKEREGRRYFEIPLYLNDSDELERRLVIGMLYVARSLVPRPLLMDDVLAFIVNERYFEAFSAMMRPYLMSINRYLDARDILRFNPVIITPGGAGVSVAPRHGPHRLARRDKYVIMFDGHRFEVPLQEVRKLVQSQ